MEKYDTFAKSLRGLRNIRKLSRNKISEITEIPVGSIRQYEAGRSAPSIDRLEALADALGIDMDTLWRGAGLCAQKPQTAREFIIERMFSDVKACAQMIREIEAKNRG